MRNVYPSLTRCLLIFATSGVGGCSWFAWMTPAQDKSAAPAAAMSGVDAGDNPFKTKRRPEDIVVVRLMFDVERFVVPTDSLASQRDQVWKYVDELRLDPASAAHLMRNGFRIGVIAKSAFAGIQTALTDLNARGEHMTQSVQDGAPLTLDLGPVGENQSVFFFRRNGTLDGKTFSGGTRLIHVDYNTVMTDAPRTALRVTPEVFKESDRPYWQLRDGNVQYRKEYEGTAYRELAVEIEVGPEELLVIGAAEADAARPMLGRMMLSEIVGGRRWETILCIEPRVYRDQPQSSASP